MNKNFNQKNKNRSNTIFFELMLVCSILMSIAILILVGDNGGPFLLWVAILVGFDGWVTLGVIKLAKGDVTRLLEEASTIKLAAILLLLAIIWPISVRAAKNNQ